MAALIAYGDAENLAWLVKLLMPTVAILWVQL